LVAPARDAFGTEPSAVVDAGEGRESVSKRATTGKARNTKPTWKLAPARAALTQAATTAAVCRRRRKRRQVARVTAAKPIMAAQGRAVWAYCTSSRELPASRAARAASGRERESSRAAR